MRIDLLCNDGSPLAVIPDDIYGRGVGGAEMAMLSLMETFAKRGHEVRVFNDPRIPGFHRGVSFLPLAAYENRLPRDVLIIFRSPNNRVRFPDVSQDRVLWWSTDQYTIGNFAVLAGQVQYCIAISAFHADYLVRTYHIDRAKIGVIDLGVRLEDYAADTAKVRNRLIFTSVPDRGLQVLHAVWPLLLRRVPDATLAITSDYRLWGLAYPNNQQHRLAWAGAEGVRFLGRVDRMTLAREQLEAEILAYPSTYEELFCLAVAEAQVAGALPVTTTFGALPTTNQHGILVAGNPTMPRFVEAFVDRIASLLGDERSYLEQKSELMRIAARRRFAWDGIAESWEHVFEHGKIPEGS